MSGRLVLVVAQEARMCRMLRMLLGNDGYEVEFTASGEEALNLVALAPPAAVVLDLVLTDMSELDLFKELRELTTAPIIVLSSVSEEHVKVEVLDLGADDYLTKPFGGDEFLARLRAALRRAPTEAPAPTLKSGELELDQARRIVTVRGQRVHLTPTEYEVLRYLMANADKVITHSTLLSAVWGSAYESVDSTLRVFIAQLRRKIEPDPARPRYIQTEPRIGYRFCSGVAAPVGSTTGRYW